MTKLDHSKITTNKKPKERDYDPVPQLRLPVIFTPKITKREAEEKTQINQKNLEEKLVFVASEEFNRIILKEPYLKKIEDLIHELRASTYRSARLSDADLLIIKARAVIKHWRSLLPSRPSKDLRRSLVSRIKDRTRKKTRASKCRMG